MGNEKFSAAIESFREALKRLPDGKDATSHRAACYTKQAESYLRLVNYSMCSQKCDLVIKMDEKEQIDQKNEPKGLGGFQYVFMKNWTTAIFFFEKTGRRNKNCWTIREKRCLFIGSFIRPCVSYSFGVFLDHINGQLFVHL